MSGPRLKQSPSIDPEEFIDEVCGLYPTKVAKKRRKHMVVRVDDEKQQIDANSRTVPGIITQRGCCFAGCKGVVIGPIGDIVHLVHGPVGCSFYSWNTRRNLFRPREDKQDYSKYCFTTDMQDQDIIFGGEKKLRKALEEAYEIFHPKAISVHATCPVGLIGDDIQSVAREMSDKLGISILAFNCEGYKGVSQSGGHHIANNKLFQQVVGADDTREQEGCYLNIDGEYNLGG
ncbi:MAG: nitrogenase component 1, partial [Deltaproteobacteria bacterium]